MNLELVDVEVVAQDPAWRALFEAQAGPANAFCAPDWVVTWYRHFVPEAGRRRLCFVRSGTGELVGVAPLWVHEEKIGPLRAASRLRLAGAGQGTALLELPQVLAAEGQSRAVLGAVVAALATPGSALAGVDVAELMIGDGQGWLEPEWMVGKDYAASSWQHVDASASVIVPLRPSWPETLSGLKRNVKESLRRSRNRLAKQDLPYEVRQLTTELDAAAVNRFFALHESRSERADGPQHHDAFAEPERRQFLRELLPKLGANKDAAIWELWLDGRHVASQLVLHAPHTLYVHSSGFDQSTWELAPVTHLQENAFRTACEAGRAWVNLSPGPNVAKLRWSEKLLRHDEFWLTFGSRVTVSRQVALGMGRVLRVVTHNAKVSGRGK